MERNSGKPASGGLREGSGSLNTVQIAQITQIRLLADKTSGDQAVLRVDILLVRPL